MMAVLSQLAGAGGPLQWMAAAVRGGCQGPSAAAKKLERGASEKSRVARMASPLWLQTRDMCR
jgi:hypothetical protein